MTAVDDPRIRPTDPPWLVANIDRVLAFRPLPADKRCRVPDCERTPETHGLCLSHRVQANRAFGPQREHVLERKRRWAADRRAARKEADR